MRVPMLCYHRIEIPPAGHRDDTNFTTPSRFRSHVETLAALGCTGVTVASVLQWQRGEATLPPRAVAITFDDAYDSVVAHAFPVLTALGWAATIFAVSRALGGTNRWDTDAPPAQLLDARALRDAHAMGHDVGSHTRHHRRVRGLSDADARSELAGSRQDLEDALGAPCESLAFPYGSHDRIALRQVEAAGYRGACTLKRWGNGRRTNPLRLGRMSVGGPISSFWLVAKLSKLMLTPSRD